MKRYEKHILLEEIGLEGQNKISQAKVLVIGAGGLGCPVLQYLTAAGVGMIGIVDVDTICLSNLQRQILYTEKEVGKLKVEVAKKHLESLNSTIKINTYPVILSENNALDLISQYDIIVDCTDNFRSRYIINDACVMSGKVFVFAAIYKFEGQLSVFNFRGGTTYRCLFPNPPKEAEVPNCNQVGVLGVLAGIMGIYQANEVLKILLNHGNILSGQLLTVNLLSQKQTILFFEKDEKKITEIRSKKSIEPIDLNDCIVNQVISLEKIKNPKSFYWVDVREEDEEPKINSSLVHTIPLSKFLHHKQNIPNKENTILFCGSGVRSLKALTYLKNAKSLEEGASQLKQYLEKYE